MDIHNNWNWASRPVVWIQRSDAFVGKVVIVISHNCLPRKQYQDQQCGDSNTITIIICLVLCSIWPSDRELCGFFFQRPLPWKRCWWRSKDSWSRWLSALFYVPLDQELWRSLFQQPLPWKGCWWRSIDPLSTWLSALFYVLFDQEPFRSPFQRPML